MTTQLNMIEKMAATMMTMNLRNGFGLEVITNGLELIVSENGQEIGKINVRTGKHTLCHAKAVANLRSLNLIC